VAADLRRLTILDLRYTIYVPFRHSHLLRNRKSNIVNQAEPVTSAAITPTVHYVQNSLFAGPKSVMFRWKNEQVVVD
jgi:hypothetical protein